MDEQYKGEERRAIGPIEHQIFEKLHEVNDRIIQVSTKVESMSEEVRRSHGMHKEQYDLLRESMEQNGANSRAIGVLEAHQEATDDELHEHIDSHWKITGVLIAAAGLLGSGIVWLVEKLPKKG